MHTPIEKLTIRYHIPVALRVARALESCSSVTRVVAAVSPHTPYTRMMLQPHVGILETPGSGYSADLAYAMGRLEGAVLVTPADLPLLDGMILDHISHMYDKERWTTMMVSEGYAARLGLSEGLTIWSGNTLCRYTGISAVDAARPGAPPRYVIVNDHRLAVNMNTIQDWALLGAAQDLPKYYGL